MFLAIYRKTLGDLSEPKAILTYLLVFVSVLWFLLIGFGNNEIPDAVAKLPLAEQELELLTAYVPLTWLWGVGIGLLVAGALFVALTLATEADRDISREEVVDRLREASATGERTPAGTAPAPEGHT